MDELALHLMDLLENSLMAGANRIRVFIDEDHAADRMEITIVDNGRGMDAETLARALDPFFTTRTTRRVGLGLSLMKANAEAWDGGLELSSTPGQGTTLRIWFRISHIDRQPMGDWPGTFMALVMSRPEATFLYRHRVDEDEFEMDTAELADELGAEALRDPAVIGMIEEQVREALHNLGAADQG